VANTRNAYKIPTKRPFGRHKNKFHKTTYSNKNDNKTHIHTNKKSVTLGNFIVMSRTGSEDDRINRCWMYGMLEQILLCPHMPKSS